MFVSPISTVATSNAAYRAKNVRNNDTVQQPITQEVTGDKVSFKSISAYGKAIKKFIPSSTNISLPKTPFLYENLGKHMQDLAKGLFENIENCNPQSKPIIESLINNTNKPLHSEYSDLPELEHRLPYLRNYMEKLFPENKKSGYNLYRVDKDGISKVGEYELKKPRRMIISLIRDFDGIDKSEAIFFTKSDDEHCLGEELIFDYTEMGFPISYQWNYGRSNIFGKIVSTYQCRGTAGMVCRKYFDGLYYKNKEIEKHYNDKGEEVSFFKYMWQKWMLN